MKKITIACGALLLAGCSYLIPQQQNQTLHYQCGTTPLTVEQNSKQGTVSFLMDGEQLHLKQLPAASGTRYGDGKYIFWSKGPNAIVERNDKAIMSDCQRVEQAASE